MEADFFGNISVNLCVKLEILVCISFKNKKTSAPDMVMFSITERNI